MLIPHAPAAPNHDQVAVRLHGDGRELLDPSLRPVDSGLDAHGGGRRVVTADENPFVIQVAPKVRVGGIEGVGLSPVAVPHDGEVAVPVNGHRRIDLMGDKLRHVDLTGSAQPAEPVVIDVVAVGGNAAVGLVHDDERAVIHHGQLGIAGDTEGVASAGAGPGVGGEFGGDGERGGSELSGPDFGVGNHSVLLRGDHVPGHHEVAAKARHGHGRIHLEVAHPRQILVVDQELQPLPLAIQIVPLAADVVEVAEVLSGSGPDHHEVAGIVHGHGRVDLLPGEHGIYAELGGRLCLVCQADPAVAVEVQHVAQVDEPIAVYVHQRRQFRSALSGLGRAGHIDEGVAINVVHLID